MNWWRDAVVYAIDVRAFCDADGDGTGDLDGVRDRLGYLELLGVDALCLGPAPAPRRSDARDALIDEAHRVGLRVLVDLDAGHTGADHDWFLDAVAAPAGSAERERYHFRPGRGPGGDEPPTNWHGLSGGPAWTRVPAPDDAARDRAGAPAGGEWYLHLPDPGRPDLNWGNPEVWAETEKVLRFWVERGVDGVRIELPHVLSTPEARSDDTRPAERGRLAEPDDPRLDRDGGHEALRMVRAVLDHHPGRVAIGAVDVADPARFARYGRPGELHLAVRTDLAHGPFDAEVIRRRVDRTLSSVRAAGGTPAWTATARDGRTTADPRRRLALTLLLLALPGAVLLEAGDELGLPERGRPDPARALLPWDEATTQLEKPRSPLSLHRRALDLRREHPAFAACAGDDRVEWFGGPPGCLAFRRTGSTLVCALNTSSETVPLPPGDLLLTSGPAPDRRLPPDTAAWLS